MLIIGYGVTLGWSGPNLVVLKSPEKSPIGEITEDQASWIASFLCFGCLIGNVFFGYVTSKCGRKLPMMCMTIPIIVSKHSNYSSEITHQRVNIDFVNAKQLINLFDFFLDKLASHSICTKRVLPGKILSPFTINMNVTGYMNIRYLNLQYVSRILNGFVGGGLFVIGMVVFISYNALPASYLTFNFLCKYSSSFFVRDRNRSG